MIGIITYHSAYNYGSVLQAYATQEAVKSIDSNVKIINYRMDEQKNFYSLYRFNYGLFRGLKDLRELPIHFKRKSRSNKFESFISNKMVLTKYFSQPEKFEEIANQFSLIISGSDQILNKHSNELRNNDWKYMDPYLLKKFKGRRISYASSLGNMEEDELKEILPIIKDFEYFSVREKSTALKIEKEIGKKIQWVCDPTFLLSRNDWIKKLQLEKNDKDYILYYSLSGRDGFWERRIYGKPPLKP